ncbi:PD-(D/E)XK nuclease family protein [Halobacteriovorax sp. HLS]|uniref:RecB family exonuclease n=1 Tax=Halobacteriovorax sp. HLS TaxID=2234000 RepID=UPI000FD70AD2|nr:PD-(D/E)XK nuclease family protein [Halobacteriovorax sp. HLS]
MLSVYLYSNSKEIYDLELLENSEQRAKIICPHPMAADALRAKMTNPQRVEVLTVSKFASDLLQIVDPDLVAKRKAQLLGQLATIWKKKLSSFSADSFFDSFNLFTELRGYSLDFELIKEVLPFYDEAIQASLPIYWAYLEQLEIVDEHKANEILSHHLKEGDLCSEDETFIFWGFNHINSGQIDFFNSLAIRNTVIIPFSKEVFKQTRQRDWIRWFEAKELNEELVNYENEVETFFYPKKRLATKIAEISESETVTEILLAEKKLSVDSCLEASFQGTNFRAAADLFSSYGKKVLDQLEKVVGEQVSAETLTNYIQELLTSELNTKSDAKNFRLIKVLSLVLDALEDYINLSEDNEVLKFYDLQVLREILNLNFPRDYFIPINDEQQKCSLYGLNELENCGKTTSPLFIISEDYQGVKKGGSRYQEDVIQFLSALGPIQRPELEFLIVREKFRELIKENTYKFCIQEGLLDGDQNWNDFLKGITLKEKVLEREKSNKKSDVLVKEYESFNAKISASKIQTYIDCPRKFYYSFIERKEINSNNTKELRPNEIGSLEHEVIEKYFKGKKTWDEEFFRETVEKTYREYIVENRKNLAQMKEKLSIYEILNYSENGIKFVLNILNELPGSEVLFEAPLVAGHDVSGRIDCLVKFEDKLAVLDFKRSGFSIPSKTDIEKFSKVQLPFYLNNLGQDPKKVIFWGYVNLSEPEESLIINGEHELGKEFMAKVNYKVSSRKSVFDDMSSWFSEYKEFEQEIIDSLKNDTQWKASPLKDDVCGFCSVANLCTRGSSI